MTEQPRTCPSCTAANPPSRELCVECGAGLDDGVVPPQPVAREAPDPPAVPKRRRAHGRWLVPVLGGVVLVGVLVGGLTLVGLGPLAPGLEVPAADFEASRYTDEAEPLLLSDIATRTIADEADDEAAVSMADGDPATAWISSGEVPEDDEVLDTIDLFLDEPAWITALELRNGDHTDREAYDATSPLRQVRLRFDGGVVVMAELLDIGLQPQAIELPEPALTTVVRIDVLERVAGPSDQLAVSELDLVGWVAHADDVEVAIERAGVEPATGTTTPAPSLPLSSDRLRYGAG